MSKYVMYMGNNEVLTSTIEDEHLIVKDYFKDGGRNLDDYDRTTQNDYVAIVSEVGIE